ncbi:hypothetical protein EMIHUDRAFT_455521 [Emiliania huxleyi CCMP1516]|uniref:Uncharacterized protein n=2 Tax=Emiliania huxleyi TaxID=2903 RepID=A0A0D3KGA6_EMIH1|nr:hypothetical protein EMIHUDRAFT_455521 [Emiliania huxleyi CCMP1516]EOD34791.1 hypothetical protein EMIHUDRAFT_455521 [Emiliania huxleyi CCMP1516]|eukprot:XP_005787220.1 hypothetical protein EMIHUDRAFT_455521 [Emiliania huxleyi CCMP1516]
MARLPTRFLLLQTVVSLARARQLVTLSEFAKVALLTPTTLRAASLSVACPLVCSAAGVVGNDFDPALLSLIIAVPSSISINAAYTRRERALTCLARFRSATYALHHSIQRWGRPADRSRIQRENAALYESLCVGLESGGDDIMFRDVFRHLEEIGEAQPPFSSSSSTTIDMQRGATLFPVLFGPYVANAVGAGSVLDTWSAYLVSFLLAVTIGSLVSIQEALEDCFDGDARLDDIALPPFAPPGFSLWRSDMSRENRDLVNPPGGW